MDEQLQEDWLEQRLRDEQPYIDDAGFTAQVVQKLPAPGRPRSARAAILLGITVLASLLAYLASDGGRFLFVAFYEVAALPLLWVSLAALCCAMMLTALAASAAFINAREQR